MTLTGADNYFEDFAVGQRFRHVRGKTVTEMDNVLLTHLVMNTAEAHFNDHAMAERHPLGERIVFGGVTAAIVIGLASQDTSDNAVAEHGIQNMKLLSPVVHGDTLYAMSEVRELDEATGGVAFHHWGINQRDDVVFEVDRRVTIRRRPQEVASR